MHYSIEYWTNWGKAAGVRALKTVAQASIAAIGAALRYERLTSEGNGAVSALISFLRTLVLQAVTVLIIPLIWGLDGVWFAAVAAEVLSFAVTVIFLAKYRKKYNYA